MQNQCGSSRTPASTKGTDRSGHPKTTSYPLSRLPYHSRPTRVNSGLFIHSSLMVSILNYLEENSEICSPQSDVTAWAAASWRDRYQFYLRTRRFKGALKNRIILRLKHITHLICKSHRVSQVEPRICTIQRPSHHAEVSKHQSQVRQLGTHKNYSTKSFTVRNFDRVFKQVRFQWVHSVIGKIALRTLLLPYSNRPYSILISTVKNKTNIFFARQEATVVVALTSLVHGRHRRPFSGLIVFSMRR